MILKDTFIPLFKYTGATLLDFWISLKNSANYNTESQHECNKSWGPVLNEFENIWTEPEHSKSSKVIGSFKRIVFLLWEEY